MKSHFDLIVVGGGIMGTFHAYHAAQRNKSVLLLEKDNFPVGATVRLRRKECERWKEAPVSGREKDGSVGAHDLKGAARALPIEQLEVRSKGPLGGEVWEPLTERAHRTEQLGLL